MSHAPGSPRAATGTPSFDPYAPHDPYGALPDPYAPYDGGAPYGTACENPYADAYGPPPHDPFGQPHLPRQTAGPGTPARDDAAGHHGPPEGTGGAPGTEGRAVTEEAVPTGRGAARRAAAADRRKRPTPRERPEALRRLLPQALVVAFLAGGTSAFVASDKSVQLSVDGKPRTLHTFADDVDELLDDEGMRVGEHDIVAPGPQHDLASGDRVIVRYGRPVTLTLDGERRQVWTTARTVDGALRQLGVRAEGAYLSASRSAPIGRTGLDLDVRTERTITFMADGSERTLRTNAATVREAIDQAGISLHGQDTTSVDPESFPRDGQTISVMRITADDEVREEPIPYATERREDPTLYKGTEVVAQQGEKGVERVTYALRTVNGVQQKPKKISSVVVRPPRTEIIRVGTKPRPTSVRGTEGLNWESLAQCEAGGRPGAVDPSGTYGGLYQFDTRTWHSLGGTGRPQDASAAEQTFRAKKLYVSRGASPWPVCGRKLHG
ncbi:resuscitation-promoting factor [Streptomyces cinnamoneus]|uniref:Resuscitation-promoting factor n=1 Tax=Streptomyces cinnamoneus TaxID=53446 RepID=A0A2G1XIZ0_STRCJ|nr:resuscitation-promoting factor [Streptomyces cinnamoneus]PHQ51218.1 resuscitation-promoting factor [Streptomyces cinnamoneus]PPT13558.1 DUF348 domain-containing protein [Streptomyces cinnamoneus]